MKPWILALTAALACGSAQAATMGHSRLLSALGQPLRIDVQVTGLSADERNTLSAAPARQADWSAAGLVPPVDLSSLKVQVADGYAPGSKVLHISSPQAFNQPVADLLLDVRSAAGSQRYQVSLLTQMEQAAAPGVSSAASGAAVGRASAAQVEGRRIRVRRADNMFAIANRNAVRGVSVYQMMMALQKANPQAFIENNVNLVKAGSTLVMPSAAALTALSDHEARRLFMQHAQAFAAYRQRLAGSAGKVGGLGAADAGTVAAGGAGAPAAAPASGPNDRLRLSEGAKGNGAGGKDALADNAAAMHGNIEESAGRVSQLEENVRNLNQALQARGQAASDLVREGARSLAGSSADGQAGGTAAGAAGKAGSAGGADSGAGSAAGTGGVAGGVAAGAAAGAAGAKLAQAGASGSGSATSGQAGSAQAGADAASGSAVAGGDKAAGGSVSADGSSAAGSPAAGAGSASQAASAAGTGAAAGGAGSASGGSAAGAGSAAGGAASGSASAGGSSAAGGNAAAGSGAVAGESAASTAQGGHQGAAAGAGQSGGVAAAGAGQAGSAAQAGAGSSPAAGADQKSAGGSSAAAGNSKGGPEGASALSSEKAGQAVSWFQEHTVGVITGVLALIVLIIAWLLRRAGAARAKGGEGVITEAMVQEKLDQINLDLSDPSPAEPRNTAAGSASQAAAPGGPAPASPGRAPDASAPATPADNPGAPGR